MGKGQGHLPRLSRGAYRGLACVHWIHTIRDRRTGWLGEVFHFRFREILFHTLVRYRLCCPVYCLMPDHIHLVWIGWDGESDQRRATEFCRRHNNAALQSASPGVRFQRQPYDHVLREDERGRGEFEVIAAYIAANPARAGIIAQDRVAEYPFAGCMVPGHRDLWIWDANYWQRFWKIYEALLDRGRRDGHA